MRWAVVVFLSLGFQGSAQQAVWKPKPATPAMAHQLFAWFDRHGYDALVKARIFRLERWAPTEDGGRKLDESWYAFERGHGHYLDFSLNEDTWFDKAVPSTYEAAIRAELGKPDPMPEFRQYGLRAEAKSRVLVEAIVWARLASMRGREDLALKFLDKALVMNWGEPLLEFVKGEMSEREFDETVHSLLDPRTSWSDFRTGLTKVVTRFPDQPSASLARDLIRQVDATMKFDRKRAGDPIDKLIDGLVKELSWNYLGWERASLGPGAKLADLGFKAVPQLIAALDDRRLTRTIYGWNDRKRKPGCLLQQVRTRAADILERISGQHFLPTYNWVPSDPDQLIAVAKPKALAWWATVKDRREVDVLRERMLREDYSAALDLAKRYPEAFPETLRALLDKGGQYTSSFRDILGTVRTPGAVRLAGELIQEEKDLSAQLSWASTFADTAPAIAARVMLKAWNAYPKGHEDPRGLAGTMVTLGDPEAVDAVARVLDTLPFQDRYGVVSSLSSGLACSWDGKQRYVERKSPSFAAYKKSIEKLLVSELSDTAWSFEQDLYDSREDHFFDRTCDTAALALSKCFPDKYKYVQSERLEARDAMCRRMGGDVQPGPRGPLVVRSVRVHGASLPAEAVAMVRSWTGKRLTAELVLPLFEMLSKMDLTTPGFYFAAVRDKSGSGFQVNMEAAPVVIGRTATTWDTRESGDIGPGNGPVYKVDTGIEKLVFQRERWIAFLNKVEKAPSRQAVQMLFMARHS